MHASVIYPHQLFVPKNHPALALDRPVYLVEEPLLLTYNPIHRQKLIFHKLSLDAYQETLRAHGYEVKRLMIQDLSTSADVFHQLEHDGVHTMHIVDTTDCYLEQSIATCGIERIWYESPLFILSRSDALTRLNASKRQMAAFYKNLRRDRSILIDSNGKPTGGRWSYDADNRQTLPPELPLPADPAQPPDANTAAAATWADAINAEQYGTAGCWLPYTHTTTEEWLDDFLYTKLINFGTYEDAISSHGTFLFHSALSPLLNVGLLTPEHVIARILTYHETHDVPLNSLEGLLRQILGWREFMRASYEADGTTMRTSNYFSHTRKIPASAWTGATHIPPLDISIERCLTYGYTHHIERLMVIGNFFLLNQIHPTEVYRWFMGMYVDAYDWVMVPNVYGMSQFADGGSFATKPYISGSNYIRKMSDYTGGDWEQTWTSLYWHFLALHQDKLAQNHRLQIPLHAVSRQTAETKQFHQKTSHAYWKHWQQN